MSLNWNIHNVPNWQAKKQEYPRSLEELIWATLLVEYNIDDDAGVAEVNWRYRFLDRVQIYNVTYLDGTGVNPILDTLEIWKGLKTNVPNVPRRQWYKHIIGILTRDVDAVVGNAP